MTPNDDDRRAAECACMEIYGENPDCPQHGVATSFALKHMTAEDWQMMVMDLRAEVLASERRAYEKAAARLDATAEIARLGAIQGNCDPLEASLIDTTLSAEAQAIRALAAEPTPQSTAGRD